MSFYKDYLKNKEEEKKKALALGLEERMLKQRTTTETIVTESPSENDIKPGVNAEKIKNKMSELQKREEEERQKFLKRVKDEEPSLTIPNKEDIPAENVPMYLPQKPPKGDKLFIRIIIILLLILAIAAISFLFYYIIQHRKPIEIIREVEIIKEVLVPEAISPESLLTYDLFEYPIITKDADIYPHLLQYIKSEIAEGLLTKIMFRDQRDQINPRFMTAQTFLNSFGIIMPPPFNDRIEQDNFNLFIYSRNGINDLGFAVQIIETDGFVGMMREWEDQAANNINRLLIFLEKSPLPEAESFVSRTYDAKTIRCQIYDDESEICYSVITEGAMSIFLFTTSSESIVAAIDALL